MNWGNYSSPPTILYLGEKFKIENKLYLYQRQQLNSQSYCGSSVDKKLKKYKCLYFIDNGQITLHIINTNKKMTKMTISLQNIK